MRTLLRYLRQFVREDFRPGVYGLTVALLIISIFFNFQTDFYAQQFKRPDPGPWHFPVLFAFYALPFGLVLWISLRAAGDTYRLRSARLWAWVLPGLALLTLETGFYHHRDWAQHLDDPHLRYYAARLLSRGRSLLTVFVPLLLLAWMFRAQRREALGLRLHRFDLRLYGPMLLAMLPLIALASFDAGFLRKYPSIRPHQAAEALGWATWQANALYELVYGWSFVSVELLFRGFFVIGLSHYVGRHAVLPTTVVYVLIHFNKPLGEAISSAFGGYILGILAFYTRHIWGGVVIHLGVAWGMELAAFAQKGRLW